MVRGMGTTEDGQWREAFIERLAAAAGQELSFAFDSFFVQVRGIVTKSLEATGNEMVTRVLTVPLVVQVYRSVLQSVGLSERELPADRFVKDLISGAISEYRNRKPSPGSRG